MVSLPVLMFFGVGDLFGANPFRESAPEFVVAGILVMTGLIVRRVQRISMFIRFPMLAVCGLLLMNVYTGPGAGADLMWMHVLPLFSFAIFGRKEGLAWSVVTLSLSLIIVFWPHTFGAHAYGPGHAIRYGISIVLVTMFAYALESMRMIFYMEIQTQKKQLEEALGDVKTLSGLVPICATCKKIRDDKGYWQHLETYIATHTDAHLSHGMCNACLKKADPVVYEELKTEGLIPDSRDAEPPYRPM